MTQQLYERCCTAIALAGGQARMAAKITDRINLLTGSTGCQLSRQAVNHWKKIPIIHVRNVAEITGMSIEELRPDVFRL